MDGSGTGRKESAQKTISPWRDPDLRRECSVPPPYPPASIWMAMAGGASSLSLELLLLQAASYCRSFVRSCTAESFVPCFLFPLKFRAAVGMKEESPPPPSLSACKVQFLGHACTQCVCLSVCLLLKALALSICRQINVARVFSDQINMMQLQYINQHVVHMTSTTCCCCVSSFFLILEFKRKQADRQNEAGI